MPAISRRFGKRKSLDMTEGSIIGILIRFALPLLVGNLFQQLYNMVDAWVIGQWGESAEFAAVGSVGPIINILIGFFSGLASGAGVVISQYFGAKNPEKVHDAVHTSIVMTLGLAVLFTIIGTAGTPWILRMMLGSEGSEVYPFACTYLRIYFAGVSALLIYNMGAGILRAVGDSSRPFYFLAISACTNIVLDLVFVIQFRMGVAGVAYATIISQAVSAILVSIVLLRTKLPVRVAPRDLRIDMPMLGKIVKIGIPSAIQLGITAFSNVFVQSYIADINAIDQTSTLGGWTTYSKVDNFIFLPIQSIAVAATTFVSQNLGNRNVKRAKKGAFIAYLMTTAATVCIIIPIIIFAPSLAKLFNKAPGIVEVASILLRRITPFYLLCCVNQILSASLRGAGNSRAPMIYLLGSFVVFRQIYLYVMSNFISNDLLPIAFSYPAGWLVSATCSLICFFTYDFRRGILTESTEEKKVEDEKSRDHVC